VVRPARARLTTVAALLVLTAPFFAEAQTGRIWRVGYLTSAAADDSPRIAAFQQRLRELGYVEPQNVVLEIRSTEGKPERLADFAAELVRLKVDVIVADGNAAVEAARQATTTIPIIMAAASDPVAAGFTTSLARPRGNITGLTVQSSDVAARALQLLKEVVPSLLRVAVLWEPGLPRMLNEMDAAAGLLGLQLQPLDMRDFGELEGAIGASTKNRAGAAMIMAGNVALAHRARIADLAVKRRLPTTGLLPESAEAGWLMSYGASLTDQFRRSADFVDRIFRGARPTDLPIEQSQKYQFVINLKTAKAIGLSIPPPLLQRADEVIK
jgi:putative tryptophan/tyrosine transport system substrate-binding protein